MNYENYYKFIQDGAIDIGNCFDLQCKRHSETIVGAEANFGQNKL